MSVPRFRSMRLAWRALWAGVLCAGFSLSSASARSAWAALWHVAPVAAPEQTLAKETWMGLYMGAKKIGYSGIRITPDTYRNRPALRLRSQSRILLTVLGTSVEQEEQSQTLTDRNYKPLKQFLQIKSSGSLLRLEAVYDHAARKITCTLGSGESKSVKVVPIPPGANLTADTTFVTGGQKLAVGQKLTFHYLNPLTVTLDEAQCEALREEIVRDAVTGKDVAAMAVKIAMPLGGMTAWQTEDGDLIKGEMSLAGIAIKMVKEPQEVAQNLEAAGGGEQPAEGSAYTPPEDFAVATAVSIERPIETPRETRFLRLTLSGLPDNRFLLADPRQQAEEMPPANPADGVTARFTVQAAEFDAAKAARWPVRDAAYAADLKKALYLETDDTNIRSMAARLRGNETNLYRIASRVRDWVTKNMTADASIGVPRSASEIFLKRRGVCRDYATLYAALARSAGIPTRLCGGLVFGQGKFYYHAWAESYVGEWVAFDPTLHSLANPVPYVDATHIKLSQGDVTRMFDVVSVIGKLKITVDAVR